LTLPVTGAALPQLFEQPVLDLFQRQVRLLPYQFEKQVLVLLRRPLNASDPRLQPSRGAPPVSRRAAWAPLPQLRAVIAAGREVRTIPKSAAFWWKENAHLVLN
jgi:hypothetical protein